MGLQAAADSRLQGCRRHVDPAAGLLMNFKHRQLPLQQAAGKLA